MGEQKSNFLQVQTPAELGHQASRAYVRPQRAVYTLRFTLKRSDAVMTSPREYKNSQTATHIDRAYGKVMAP